MRAQALPRFLAARRDAAVVPAALVIAAVAVFAAGVPGFTSRSNLLNLLHAALPLFLLTLGQTLVLVVRGIDLSLPAIVGLASVVGGLAIAGDGVGASAGGALTMLALGLAAGALNGVAVTRLAMPPFMVTLTTGMFAGGAALWLASRAGTSLSRGLPPALVALGGSLPLALSVVTVTAVAVHALLAWTISGRWLYAAGRNPDAARVSGVPVAPMEFAAYAASGLLAGLAALLLTGHLETASALHGRTLLLDAIAAAVIGGASLAGGAGGVWSAILGVAFLAVLANGLTLLNVADFTIAIVKGLVILAAAWLDAAARADTP